MSWRLKARLAGHLEKRLQILSNLSEGESGDSPTQAACCGDTETEVQPTQGCLHTCPVPHSASAPTIWLPCGYQPLPRGSHNSDPSSDTGHSIFSCPVLQMWAGRDSMACSESPVESEFTVRPLASERDRQRQRVLCAPGEQRSEEHTADVERLIHLTYTWVNHCRQRIIWSCFHADTLNTF